MPGAATDGLFTQLISIVAPVYVCVAAGWAWGRLGRRYDIELMTDLIMTVGAPCLVFSSLVSLDAQPAEMLQMAGATLAALASFAIVGAGVLRIAGLSMSSYLGPMVFANTGNMGLPVSLFAFGPHGLALGVCFYATTAFTQFTVGQWLWTGDLSLLRMLRTPLTLSIFASAAVLATGISVPEWIQRATGLLGDFTIPLMQFTLGVTLGSLSLAGLPRSIALSCLRIGMGLAVGLGLAEALGLQGAARGVFILDCSMPAAVINYMLAERHGRSPADVASIIVVSTLMSLVTLPMILLLVL